MVESLRAVDTAGCIDPMAHAVDLRLELSSDERSAMLTQLNGLASTSSNA